MNKKSFITQIVLLIKKFGLSLCLILLFAISLLNKFPKDYIYSFSDFPQIINFIGTLKWFSNAFIDIGTGSVNYLYVPFYYSLLGFIQSLVGVQYISVAYHFIFLAGS